MVVVHKECGKELDWPDWGDWLTQEDEDEDWTMCHTCHKPVGVEGAEERDAPAD